MKKVFICFVSSLLLSFGCNHPIENAVICVQLDPLEKVFTEEMYFVETPDTAAVAKGETATFQFVIKSSYPIQELKIEAGNLINGDRQLVATEKAFVEYIRAGNHTGFHGSRSKDAIFPVSDLYPDCLQEVEYMDLAPMQNQPIWVGYSIPRDATSGDYSATLEFSGKVNGKKFKITKQVNAKVYPVTLPEQTLWVTNWWSSNFSKMNNNEPVEPYSDRYWESLTALANVMRDHGQNTYLLPGWNSLCNIEFDGTRFTFDFINFDKMVELFIREGGLKRIEGAHLAGHGAGGMDGIYRGFNVYVPKMGNMPFEHETAQLFLSQFLPALYSHLKTKGWHTMFVQHIGDEPLERDASLYIQIAEFVKKHMPGIPIIEAIGSRKYTNTLDIWVAILGHYHHNYEFYCERQAAGDEVWFYTCCGPQDNYANRFLELPLVQTRFLHWLNYAYGATGYLHWGYNQWDTNITNDAASRYDWPAGDAWIVYPAEGKVLSSIRLKAMRDGIADYELLKLLEKKDPDKAKKIAGEVIKGFDRYNSNVRTFRLTRLELLKSLSE